MKLFILKIRIITSCIFATSLLHAQFSERIIEPVYLFQEFKTGNVYLQNKPIQTAPLNYNTLTQEMLFMRDTTLLKLTNVNQVDSIVIENRVFIPYKNIFYEIIAGSQLKLLLLHQSRWEPVGAEAGYGRSKLAKTTTNSMLSNGGQIRFLNQNMEIEVYDQSEYVIFANNKLLPASNLKNYITLFPKHKQEMKSIAKKHKLNLNDKMDRQKFVLLINNFLNELYQ